jgi:hypothetical protein
LSGCGFAVFVGEILTTAKVTPAESKRIDTT